MLNFEDLFSRAKVRCYFDEFTKEAVFVSTNNNEPLSDLEKKQIKNLCYGMGIRGVRFEEENKNVKEK